MHKSQSDFLSLPVQVSPAPDSQQLFHVTTNAKLPLSQQKQKDRLCDGFSYPPWDFNTYYLTPGIWQVKEP